MYAFELSIEYRKAVKERNLSAVLSMFVPDAVIVSPLNGTCDARTFHEWLFSNIKTSTIELNNVFQALNGDISIAVQARYKWVLNNDKLLEFGGVSILEFTPDRKKIKKISYYYDTALVRTSLAEANSLTLV